VRGKHRPKKRDVFHGRPLGDLFTLLPEDTASLSKCHKRDCACTDFVKLNKEHPSSSAQHAQLATDPNPYYLHGEAIFLAVWQTALDASPASCW